MNDMNLFGQEAAVSNDFETAYAKFLDELNISPSQHKFYFSDIEGYLRTLYDKNELTHSPALDAVVRYCFHNYPDEYSQAFTYLQCFLFYLNNGASLEELSGVSLGHVIALNQYHRINKGVYNVHRELRFVKLINDEKSCTKILHALGKVGTGYTTHGIVLFELLRLTSKNFEEVIPVIEDKIISGVWNLLDAYNYAFLMNIGYSALEAESIINKFALKNYSCKSILLLIKHNGDTLNYPECDTLMDIIISNELEDIVSHDMIRKLYGYLNAFIKNNSNADLSEDYVMAIIESVYNAGFSVGFVAKDSPNQAIKTFVNLIIAAICMNQSFRERYHIDTSKASLRPNARCYGCWVTMNEKDFVVLRPEIILDSLRFMYANQQLDNVTIDSKLDYDFLAQAIASWLYTCCTSGGCSWQLSPSSVDKILHMNYTELQIMYDGAIMYHLPKDFFIEYANEIKEQVQNKSPKYCYVSCLSNENNKADNILVISFSSVQQISLQTRTNSLGFTIDLQTKKELVFDSNWRFDMPILKIMLCKYFKDNNKPVEIIESLDLQTLVGMIQVLILQDSEVYKTLFKREDSFLNGFKAMKWCVRSDDNFYSAVLRYIVNSANIFSTFYDTKLSTALESYVVLNEQQVPLLSIFNGDKSLVDYLRDNKNSVQICVRGDVVHFE